MRTSSKKVIHHSIKNKTAQKYEIIEKELHVFWRESPPINWDLNIIILCLRNAHRHGDIVHICIVISAVTLMSCITAHL